MNIEERAGWDRNAVPNLKLGERYKFFGRIVLRLVFKD